MQQPDNKDRFYRLKFIGYCWSNLPPDEAETEYEDYVRYCKFQLCKASHKLMNDPIWEQYSDEEIIAEYYAHVFSNSEKERTKFETTLQGYDEDTLDWLDRMIEKNQEELKERAKQMEDRIDFSPESLGE